MRGALPTGWELIPDPAGTRRIRPLGQSRRSVGLLLVAGGLVCCGFAGLVFLSLQHGAGSWRALRLTLLLPVGLGLVYYGLWIAFGREEWRVGADCLEVRQQLFGLRRVRRFRGAVLRLVGSTGARSSRAQRFLLRAARTGGGSTRAAGDWWGLSVADSAGRRLLSSTSRGMVRREELLALGELLSGETGWPLVLPRQRKKR